MSGPPDDLIAPAPPPDTIAPWQADPQGYFSNLLGVPVAIPPRGAFRTAPENTAVGGARGSAHMEGDPQHPYAFDLSPKGMSLVEAQARLAASGIPFDQIINEGTHVHVSLDPRRRGQVFNTGEGSGQPILASFQATPVSAEGPPSDLVQPPPDLVSPSGGPPKDLVTPPPDLVKPNGKPAATAPPQDTGLLAALPSGLIAGERHGIQSAERISGLLPVGSSIMHPIVAAGQELVHGAGDLIGMIANTVHVPGMNDALTAATSVLHSISGLGPEPAPTVAAQPIEFGHGFNPATVGEKLLHGAGASAPSMVGAIAGGPLTAGLVAGQQSFAPYYDAEIARTPDDKVGAARRATYNAAVDAAATVLSWKLFEFVPFKQAVGTVTNNITGAVAPVYEQTVADMIKNLTVQGIALQPAVSMVEQTVHNLINGRPPTEGLPQAYAQGAVANTLFLGAAHILVPPGMSIGKWRTPQEKPATGFQGPFEGTPPAERLAPPSAPGGPQGGGPAPAGAAALAPNTEIGLHNRQTGGVDRAVIQSISPDGKTATVRYDNGDVFEHLVSELHRDMAPPPPPLHAEPQPIYRGPQLTPEERAAPPLGEPTGPKASFLGTLEERAAKLDQMSTDPSLTEVQRREAKDNANDLRRQAAAYAQPQPELDPRATHALSLADRLEKNALDMNVPMQTQDRLAALTQAARLRQQFGSQPGEEPPERYRHPLSGEPSAPIGALARARVDRPDLYQGEYQPPEQPPMPARPTPQEPEEAAPVPKRPPDLLQFLSSKGGLKGDDPYHAGDLQQMQAHRKFMPGQGMLVRKNGLNLDRARELAAESGYGVEYNNFDTVDDMMDALRDSLKGKDVFSHTENGGIDAALAWQQHRAAERQAPPEEENREVNANIDALRDKAEHYGIPVGEDWSAEDLMAAVTEHEAIAAERAGGEEPQNVADARELDMDYYLAARWPEVFGRLEDEGVAQRPVSTEGQPVAEPEAAEVAPGRGEEAEPAAEREAGPPEPGGHAGERGAPAPEPVAPERTPLPVEAEQAPALERAARRQIEEAGQLPRAHGKKPQRPVAEGLFAPPPPATGDLLNVHEAEARAEPEPSHKQIEAGNYRKGHVDIQGLPVTIETPSGAERRGVGPTGEPWAVTLEHPYGYVKGTKGADHEHVDVYIGPHPDSPDVFVVDQIDPQTKAFDEHKAILGARNESEAREIYDAGFSDGSGPARAGAITPMPVEQFREWLDGSQTKKPVAYVEPAAPEPVAELPTKVALMEQAQELGLKPMGNATREEVAAVVDMRQAAITPDAQAAEARDLLETRIDHQIADVLPEVLDDEQWSPAGAIEASAQPQAPSGVGEVRGEPAPVAGEAPGREGVGAVPAVGAEPGREGVAPSVEGSRAVDSRGNPIFKKGERVVLTDGPLAGRHGEIVRADGITMRSVFPGRGMMKEETTYHYTVKTDEGAETYAAKFEPETAPPTNVVKDPVWEGKAVEPDYLQRVATSRKSDVARFEERGSNARKPDKKAEWARMAKKAKDESELAARTLADWKRAKGVKEPVAETPPVLPPSVAPSPVEGVDVRENAERQGVEIRFKGRPDDAVLAKLKGAGFRWSRPQRLWYARISEKTRAVAASLKGGEAPKPAEPTQADVTQAFATAAARREMMDRLTRHSMNVYEPDGRHYRIDTTAGHEWLARKLGPERENLGYFKTREDAAKAIVDRAMAEGSATPPISPLPEPSAKGWREIGHSINGETLYEDQRGVRSRIANGIRYSEPVALNIGRPGVGITTDRNAHPEFKLASEVTSVERTDTQAAAQGARAEIDAGDYQPAAMPITAASPSDKGVKPSERFERGDAVEPKPENTDLLPPGTVNRYVTDVSEDGRNVTLDGGAELPASALQEAGEGSKLRNGLQGAVRPTTEGTRSEAVSTVGREPSNRPAPSGQEPGGARAVGRPARVGTERAGRTAEGPAGVAPRGRTGQGTDVRLPAAGEGPEPGAAERPDALVQGTNFSIESGALEEGRGPKLKAADNLSAIRLAKTLTAEQRPATREEQAVLSKYVGWGGLSGAFENNQGNFGTGFEDIGRDLKKLLTPDEYKTASRSTQYAHYTAENVIRAMWQAVENMGFKGGSVFEPGMGIGHFLGLMPTDVAAASHYQGIEIDHLTADIAKLLYPQSGVRQADFTQTPLPEDTFDLVIGNPPFSDTVIKADPKYAARGFMLHDYFFAKSLDSVRPGGLLAFVTSAGTMNKLDDTARVYMGQRAEFLGGVRLPSTAFKKNAGTEVTTDVLFFKKRDEQISAMDAGKEPWTSVVKRTLPDGEGGQDQANVSRYFTDHPEQVLGNEGLFDKLYKGRYAVHAPEGVDLTEALATALDRLPKDVMAPPPSQNALAELDFVGPEKKDGSFYIANGKLFQYSGGVGRPVEKRGAGVEGGMSAADMERVQKLIPLRDALRDVFAHDLAENVERGNEARERLNKHYDAFVAKFGPINKVEFQYRRPNIIQEESARAEALEQARDRGEPWNHGSFDPTQMVDAGASLQEIARARKQKKEMLGSAYEEGTFDPSEIPDTVIEKRPNINPFYDDPESYRMRAIENYNDATHEHSKKRIFFESVLTREMEPKLDSANDGVLWSLNKFGRLDLDKIADQMKRDKTDLVGELGNSVFRVPNTEATYQTSDEYLSGDIVDKLAKAEAAAAHDPEVRRNVDALRAALPAPLSPSEIAVNLGMPWVPPDTIEQFVRDHLRIGEARIRHSPALGGWTVGEISNGPDSAQWGVEDRPAFKLLSDALNRTPPRIYRDIYEGGRKVGRQFDPVATQGAQDKYDAMRAAFQDWVAQEPERIDNLASIYNDKLNRTVLRKFDGSYLTTPGVSSDWRWRPHQQRVVARIIQAGNTYVAHAVGAGKTSEMIGAGMEMRRLGLVKKPMFVVPNHMLAQFTKEFYEQYPTARIAVADERRFHTSRRKQFMANVAQSDLDAVIITHSSFGMIPISAEFQNQLINEELDNLAEAMDGLDKQDDRITIKKLENQKEKLEQKLLGAFNTRKDKGDTFEQMGVDHLFVDEAHMFRKLQFASRQNLKGIDPKGSDMAWDLYSKIRYLDSKSPGRSVVLASGTPVTNTMGELYTLSKYLQLPELQKRGIAHFDSWAATFGDTKTGLEQTPDGGYAPVTRFNRFVNIPELYKMVGDVMDIVTPAQLDQYVVRPKLKGGKRIYNLAPRSEFLDEYQADLARRMQEIKMRKGPPKKGDDIILSVINDGRKAAIDPRFVIPTIVPSDAEAMSKDSKLSKLIDNTFDIWKRTASTQFYDPKSNYQSPIGRKGPATQMIFSNLGINKDEKTGFSGYEWMKRELVRRGVPPKEIAFIGDYKGHVARQKLFNDMNEGIVRILIGSTQKMGTGVNAQRRLYAIHNLDPLWFPADDEQRVGRGLRQGNLNPEIEIHDYSTKGTYDSSMWQMMGNKGRFIEQFFRGDPELRDMEDLGEASHFEQAAAIATSDERLIQLTDLRQQLDKAQRREQAHDREQYSMRSRLQEAARDIARIDRAVPVVEGDIKQRVATAGDKFKMTIAGKSYVERGPATDALVNHFKDVWGGLDRGHTATLASLGGFKLIVGKSSFTLRTVPDFYIERSDGTLAEIGAETPQGAIRSVESRLPKFENELAYLATQKAESERVVASLQKQIGKPFTGGEEIARLKKEVKDLEIALTPKKEEPPAAAPETATKAQMPNQPRAAGAVDKHVALNDDLIARLPTNPTPVEQELIKGVETLAKRIVPSAKVYAARQLLLLQKNDKGQREGHAIWGGMYPNGVRRLIAWSMESPNAQWTMRHEAVHYLRNLEFLTPKEWETLSSAAEAGNWMHDYEVDERWPDLDHAQKIEESVAEKYAHWAKAKTEPKSFVERIFAKIKDLLDRVKGYLRQKFGKDATFEDIFRAMESGEIGNRPLQKAMERTEPEFARQEPVGKGVQAQEPRGTEGPAPQPPEGRDYIDQTAHDIAEATGKGPPGTYARTLQSLDAPDRGDRFMDANALQRHVMGPRTVAELDTPSAKLWNRIKERNGARESLVNDLRDRLAEHFLKLPEDSQTKVLNTLELDRLDNRTRINDGRSIIARNEKWDTARGSKVGESWVLNPEESKGYFDLQNMFRRAWDHIMHGTAVRLGWDKPWGDDAAANIKAVEDAAENANHPRARKEYARLADVLHVMEAQRRAAYMPLMRHGSYFISVKPKVGTDLQSEGGFPQTKWFELVERPAMSDYSPKGMLAGKVTKRGEVPEYAKARLDELKKQFPNDTIEHGWLTDKPAALRDLDIPAVEKLFTLMEGGVLNRLKEEESAGGSYSKKAARAAADKRYDDLFGELVDAIRNEMYENLKAGFKRKSRTVAGYSEDFHRSLGSYVNWTSGHVADNLHRDEIERAYNDIQINHPHKSMKDFWRKWREDDESPSSPLSRAAAAANQIGFLYTLAWNPASTTSIMMHGPTFAIPVLGTGINQAHAAAAFSVAYGQASLGLRFNTEHGAYLDWTVAAKTPRERAYLKGLADSGELHAKGADDIRSMGEQAASLWGEHAPIVRRAMDIASSNIGAADQLNRVAVALAAFRLARDGKLAAMNKAWADNQVWREMSHRLGVSPETMGRFLLSQGVGEWGAESRSEFGRAPLGRLATSLHGFQIRFMSNLAKQAFRQGGAGKLALMWSMLALWAGAGLQGLPFMQDAENTVDWLWRHITGKDPMVAAHLRQYMADAGLGKIGADLILRGPASVLSGVDFGSRLGFGDILTREVAPWIGAADQAALTVPSIVMGAYNGFTKLNASHQTAAAWAYLLPAALRHPAQAIIATQHGYKSQTGRTTYVPHTKVTPTDTVGTAMGFTPLDVARKREKAETQYQMKHTPHYRVKDMTP